MRTARARVIGTIRGLERLAESLLHGMRRKRVLKRLGRGALGPALFICHGNIYRSPFAALAFRKALPAAVREANGICSAGFVGPDRPSPEAAIRAAEQRGIDLRDHRSRLLTRELIERARWIVVMDAHQLSAAAELGADPDRVVILGDLDPLPIDRRSIPDPWDRPAFVLEASYTRIERCVAELARALASE